MKLTVSAAIICISALSLYATPGMGQEDLNKRISLQLKDVALKDAIDQIGTATGISFVFAGTSTLSSGKVSMSFHKARVADILHRILAPYALTYLEMDNHIVIRYEPATDAPAKAPPVAIQAARPPHTVKGVVENTKGEPLGGVSIAIKGSKRGVQTNDKGEFTIDNLDDKDVLLFTMQGYKLHEITVGAQTFLRIQLISADSKTLDEVVVTGFQTIDRKKFTGAAVTLKADSIRVDGMTDISRMLEGRAAGVSIQNVSGTFGTAPKIRIRGATSINGENKPLWVIDGVVLEDIVNVSNEQLSSGDASTLLGSSVAGLNPADIETMDILKDASAAALYGSRAMNGVIVITTKKGKLGKPVISYTGNFGVQIRPSYSTFDIMNSADQMSVNAELERKQIFTYPGLVNAQSSGIYGEMAKLLQTPGPDGKFAVENSPEGRQAWLMKYANINTDWFKLLFRNSVTQEHSLSISTGTDKARSYFSTSFFSDPGWSISDNVKRYTANVRQDYTPSNKLSFGFLIGGSVRQQRAAGTENRNSDPLVGAYSRDFDINPFSYALNTTLTLPAFNDDGSYNFSTKDYAPFNILYETQNNYTKLGILDGKLQGNLSYKITPNFSYDFVGALRYSKSTEEHNVLENSNEANAYRAGDPNQPNYNSIINANNPFLYQDPALPFNQAISILPYGGFYKRVDRTLLNYTFRNQISYKQSFKDQLHQIVALIGQEYRSIDRQTANDNGVGYQYNTGGVPFVDYRFFKKMVETSNTYYGMYNEYDRTAAFFANAQYTYNNRYTIMGTVREDGSNRMGASSNARWLPTWTVAGTWNVDQEKFMQGDRNPFSHLLIKSSYGLNASIGNAINSTTILRSMMTNRQYLVDQQTGIVIQDLQNANLSWEKKYEFNIGTDLGLFNERIGLTFDWYQRRSFDLIGLIRTSGIGGQVDQYANYANMKSHGFDLAITGKIVREKDWSITSTLNMGFNTTLITNLKNTPNIWQLVSETGGAKQGYPVRGLFSLNNQGLDPMWGTPLFISDSGIVSSQVNLRSINTSNLKYQGPTDPTITGGWFNSFRYKDLSLSVLFTFQAGNKVRLRPVYGNYYSDLDALPNEYKRRFELPGDDKLTNIPSILMFQRAGYELQQKNAFPYNNYNYSEDRVADGGFVRMKAVTLTYALPARLVNAAGLKTAFLSATGNNLWLVYSDSRLHGQDPEFFTTGGVALPVNKQVTFSLKVGL